jgi:hypothetical protein
MLWVTYEHVKAGFDFANTIITILGVLYAVWKAEWTLKLISATGHLGKICQDEDAMGYFVANLPSAWWKLMPFFMTDRVSPPLVPTVSAFIEAGDDGWFTTGMLDSVSTPRAAVSWVPLYEAFFREYVWAMESRSDDEFPKLRFRASEEQEFNKYLKIARFEVEKIKQQAQGHLMAQVGRYLLQDAVLYALRSCLR